MMKKILIISNLLSYTYNFRKEIIDKFIEQGHSVTVLADIDDTVKNAYFESIGCKIVHVPFDGKGTSIKKDARTLLTYFKNVIIEKPDVIFTYTIKPNLYGGLAAKILRKCYIPMITGLGELEKTGKLQKLLLFLHKLVIPSAKCVIFQNEDNRQFFKNHNIKTKKTLVLPGSGINLNKFTYSDYPDEKAGIVFGYVGRLTVAKGIEQFLDAAEYLSSHKDNVSFCVAGKCDPQYQQRIEKLHAQGIIEYYGNLSDTHDVYKKIHCLVLPTYHPEGISNVLLESAASGRPAICTNRTGCKEVVENGYNGFFCKAKDSKNLISVINHFIDLPWKEKEQLGINGRNKVAKLFDRKIVVSHYAKLVDEL